MAARIRQLAAQAEHQRAITEFRARHAADQQQRINALLLELIAPSRACSASSRADPALASPACQNMNTEHCRIMCKQRGR